MMENAYPRRRLPDYWFCLISGLLLGLSYPSYPSIHLELFAWVWMVPLLLALKPITSFGRFLCTVYLALLVDAVISLSWFLVSTVWGTLLLFLVSALVFTGPFLGFYCIRRALGWRVALWTAPVVWTAWEWLYHQSEGSFGWMTMGSTQANLYWLVQYVDITGVWGITFWLVLFNVLVVRALEDWQAARACRPDSQAATKGLARRLALVTTAMLVFPLAYSAYVFTRAAHTASGSGRAVSVLLIQPNINPWHKMSPKARAAALGKTAALTERALATSPKPDLIIWPETAVPYVLSQEQLVREFVYRHVATWSVPLLTGTLDQRTSRPLSAGPLGSGQKQDNAVFFNAAVLLTPQVKEPGQRFPSVQSSAVYHKQVPMPFVERLPFSLPLPYLSNLASHFGLSGHYGVGDQALTFAFRDGKGEPVVVAAPICYEELYPAKIAEFVRKGAEVLALLTNDGWWSQSDGIYRITAFSRLRSMETRRSLARCANTGLTCVIDPLGRLSDQVPWWTAQTVVATVPLSQAMSLYTRYPDVLPKGCVGLSVALGLAVLVQQTRATVRWLRLQSGRVSTVRRKAESDDQGREN